MAFLRTVAQPAPFAIAFLVLLACTGLAVAQESSDAQAMQALKIFTGVQFERREEGMRVLMGLGALAVEPLIKASMDPDSALRRDANFAISGLLARNSVTASAFFARTLQSLKDPNNQVRRCAAETMRSIAVFADRDERRLEGAKAALVDALDDSDSRVRGSAALALRCLDVHAGSVLPRLTQMAKTDRDPEVRRYAIQTIQSILSAQTHAAAMAALRGQIEDGKQEDAKSDPEERAELVRMLISALADRDSDVRRFAAQSLGELELPQDSLERLIRALDDQDLMVRGAVSSALAQKGTPITTTLIDGLKSEDSNVRLGLVELLSRITNDPPFGGVDADYRRQAERCRRALVETLSDRDLKVREAAVLGLALDGDPPLRELLQILRNLDDSRWRGARAALVQYGTTGFSLSPLIDDLADESPAFCNELIDMLVEIAKAEPEQSQALHNAKHPNPRVREAVSRVLNRLDRP